MNVADTVFDKEFSQVKLSGSKSVVCDLKCSIHAGGVTYEAVRVDELEIDRNYLNRYADRIILTFTIGLGTFAGKIVPNKDKLEITVTKTPLQTTSDPNRDPTKSVEVQRYHAFLYDTGSPLIESKTPNLANTEIADNTQLKTIQVQLVDHVIIKMRTVPLGGIFRNATPIDVIRAVLGKYGKLANEHVQYSVRGVDVAPGASAEKINHIVVPHGTLINKFPRVVENTVGGIYPTGFSYYLQAGMWYVFAPYDIKRYFKSTHNLTILNIPANRLESIENSFRTTNGQVVVLATGDIRLTDNGQREQNNLGNGVRFLDAAKIMLDFVKTEGNKAIASRANSSTEMALEKRENGIDLVSLSERVITSNYMAEYSKLAKRSGMIFQLKWQSSMERLIYPGMPVRVMYLNGAKDESLYGITIGSHTIYRPTNIDPKIKRFASETQLTVFVGRQHSQ